MAQYAVTLTHRETGSLEIVYVHSADTRDFTRRAVGVANRKAARKAKDRLKRRGLKGYNRVTEVRCVG